MTYNHIYQQGLELPQNSVFAEDPIPCLSLPGKVIGISDKSVRVSLESNLEGYDSKNDTIKTTVKTDTSRFEIGQTVRYEIYMMGCLTRQKLTPLSN